MEPILTAHLFLPLQTELVTLLRSLAPADWSRPTVAGSWKVKDVVAHLLDTDLRRLSMHRDGYAPESIGPSPADYEGILRLINDLNRSWVDAARRLSPATLINLLEWTGPQLATFFASLAPEDEAHVAVAWAGETRSANWMDIGREYTEKWHHQSQIRDAVGAPLLMNRKWLWPVLAISMYALPYSFRSLPAPDGHALNVRIDGEAGGEWFLIRDGSEWKLNNGGAGNPAATVRMDADAAWRLFFNGLEPKDAERRIEVKGDALLCSTFMSTRSVMV